jgi:hypothetical protein
MVAVCTVLSCGCTTEEASRNVYEGVKSRDETLHSRPPENSSPRAPTYEEYERERRALSKPSSQ